MLFRSDDNTEIVVEEYTCRDCGATFYTTSSKKIERCSLCGGKSFDNNTRKEEHSYWLVPFKKTIKDAQRDYKKKTINIVEFQRTQYNTSDNWVDKNNCFLSYDGILLDSLEIFQIIEEENNLQNNVNDIIDNDEISNDNKESDFIINTDKNMIEEKNISKQLKGKNKNEKNKKGLLEKEKKKYEENSKQNILDIRNSNDNSNFSLAKSYRSDLISWFTAAFRLLFALASSRT